MSKKASQWPARLAAWVDVLSDAEYRTETDLLEQMQRVTYVRKVIEQHEAVLSPDQAAQLRADLAAAEVWILEAMDSAQSNTDTH